MAIHDTIINHFGLKTQTAPWNRLSKYAIFIVYPYA